MKPTARGKRFFESSADLCSSRPLKLIPPNLDDAQEKEEWPGEELAGPVDAVVFASSVSRCVEVWLTSSLDCTPIAPELRAGEASPLLPRCPW